MKKAVIGLLIFLSGCQISPYYKDSDTLSNPPIIRSIAGREGQKLRSELQYLFSSYPHNLSGYIIRITLKKDRSGDVFDEKGVTNRLTTSFEANVSISDPISKEFVLNDVVTVSQSNAMSGSSSEILLSFYSDIEDLLLKKLANAIFVKVNEKCKSIGKK